MKSLDRIFLDVAHGGADRGCSIQEYQEYDEANYILRFCEVLSPALRAEGFLTLTSRCFDTTQSHETRSGMSREFGADLVLCPHVNADPDPNFRGGIFAHWPDNQVGLDLCARIASVWPIPSIIYSADEPMPDMPAWKQTMLGRMRTVIGPHEATAILCELFDAADRRDRQYALLVDGRDQMVRTIVQAVCRLRDQLTATAA